MSWLHNAIQQSNKPKDSIIGVLKRQLGGQRPGRDRSVLHASDITATDFCPRREALRDLKEHKTAPQFLQAAMDVTFQIGTMTETLLVEEWAGEYIVGNWRCRYCGDHRTMCSKPDPPGFCAIFKGEKKHWWQYLQLQMNAEEYDVSGSIDAVFNVGSPRLIITEVKILNPDDFEKIVVPKPEHRLRTSLYMKLIAESTSVYKEKFNVQEARVLYVSRAYGKMNLAWNEILPFKEFVVTRDDEALKEMLQKAKAVKLARAGQGMPNGICATALDKVAKNCGQCKDCFSGQFPAQIAWGSL